MASVVVNLDLVKLKQGAYFITIINASKQKQTFTFEKQYQFALLCKEQNAQVSDTTKMSKEIKPLHKNPSNKKPLAKSLTSNANGD